MKWSLRIFIVGWLMLWLWGQGVDHAWAADFYRSTGEMTMGAGQMVRNPYAMAERIVVPDGGKIEQDAHLLANELLIDGAIEGSLQAAASRLELNGQVGRAVRVVGGEVIISGQVGQDVVIIGGQARLTESAVIGGDLLFIGSSLTVAGQVKGSLISHCACDVTIQGEVGRIEAYRINRLVLAGGAQVRGPINYRGPVQAEVDKQATVEGAINWQTIYGDEPGQRPAWTSSVFYGLLSSLIFCSLLWLYLFKAIVLCLHQVQRRLWMSFMVGLLMIGGWPIVATLSFIPSIWLGAAMWLGYGLLLITSYFGGQILLGWWLLQWWHGREGADYHFDWRAVVVGCLVSAVMWLVPVVGLPILLGFSMVCLGSIGLSLFSLRR